MNKLVLVCTIIVTLSLLLHSSSGQDCSDVQIYNTFFNSTISQILFTTQNQSEIYVRTRSHLIYKSIDYGHTFLPQMDKMPNFFNGGTTGQYGVVTMRKGAQDGLVYFVGYNYYWVTRGDGVYKGYDPSPDYIYDLVPHPTNPYLVLREMFINCNNNATGCVPSLSVSEAQGLDNSWDNVRDYVYEYAWGGNETQIFMISVPAEFQVGDYRQVPIEERYFYVTNDFGETLEVTQGPGFYNFLYNHGVLYAGYFDEETRGADFYMSTNNGGTFIEAEFHGKTNNHVDSNLYNVLDNSEGVSFVSVCSSEHDMLSDLYESELSDGQFWLALPNQRTTCNYNNYRGSDFQRVYGMNGIYIANGYNVTESEIVVDENLENYIQTGITYDKGGAWEFLPPPTDTECATTPGCHLHLFSMADSGLASPIVTTETATGLVIATGTEGQFRGALQDSSTYLSRSGGMEWQKIKSGNNMFAMLRSGSVFLSTTKGVTNQISYSWRQGLDWTDCTFNRNTSKTLSVQTIYPIPDTVDTDLFFLVRGEDSQTGNGFLTLVDLTDTAPRICGTTDYEVLQSQVEGKCLLGQLTQVRRRKQQSACLSIEGEVSTPLYPCACNRDDYTCDGECWREEFTASRQSTCVNICVGTPQDPEQPPAHCQGTWMKSQGYRKVDGDVCEGGLDLNPVEMPCPGGAVSASSSPTPSQTITPSGSFTPQSQSVTPIVTSASTPAATPTNTPEGTRSALPTIEPEESSKPTPTAEPVFETPSSTPVVVVTASSSPSPVSSTTTDGSGLTIGMVIMTIAIVLVLLIVIIVIILIVLYKTNTRVRGLLRTYLPKSLGGGGNDEVSMYSLFGEDNDENALFLNDDFDNVDDFNVNQVSSDKTPLGPLDDIPDDDAEGAIDITF